MMVKEFDMALYEFEGKRPLVHESAFVYPEAVLIGEVIIGPGCYIGAGAVIRGDWGRIEVAEGSNIQENCVIHTRPQVFCTLGSSSHIGHGAILHGPKIGTNVLVGMGAIIQDNVELGDGAIVGSGALILEGTKVPPKKLIVGVPGRIVGEVSEALAQATDWGTRLYQTLPSRCHATLRRIA
jgi:carbonic anhydrase/acetyltransferase-like protein (isoleucine patch superfamily)